MHFVNLGVVDLLFKKAEEHDAAPPAPVFEMKDVVFVEISEIRELDPELRTFMNINTAEDMEFIIESAGKNRNYYKIR